MKKRLISICIVLILIALLCIVFTSCGSAKVARFGRHSSIDVAKKLESEGFEVGIVDEDSLLSVYVNMGDNSLATISTDSMEPTLSKGDVIIAKTFDGNISKLKVGQIVTFKAQIRIGNAYYESFNTHRIIQIRSNGTIVTRGDNQNAKDGNDWKNYTESTVGTQSETIAPSDVVAVWGDIDRENSFVQGEIIKNVGDIDWIVTVGSKYYSNNQQVAIFKYTSNKKAKESYDSLKVIINSNDVIYGEKVVICGKNDYINDIIDIKL